MLTAAFFKGLGVGGGLIVAIGAQNAFLLRQGLQRQFVTACVLICIACDVTLIVLGAGTVGRLIVGNTFLLAAIRAGGALFLIEYGRRAARAAWRGQDRILRAATSAYSARGPALRAALALSLLNPHAWLDTVVLLGSIGAQQPGQGHLYFAAGAMTSSVLWFSCLGLGAQMLAPVFAKPASWRVLDGFIALTMWSIAVSLFIN